MSNSNVDYRRRNLLKLAATGIAAVPLSGLMLRNNVHSAELPRLSEDDATAKALNYVHDAASAPADKRKEGSFCKNCNLIQSTEGEWRPCSLFPGKAVNENGWCLGWVGRV